MLKIKTYRDDELYILMKETLDMFYEAHNKLNFKKIGEKNNITNTVWVLVMLSFRLRWLCESILSFVDYYSAVVIFRACIEHFLKYMYIFASCFSKGDDIAKEYVSEEHISDEILTKYRKALWPDNLESTKLIRKPDKFRKFKKRTSETAKKFRFSEVVTSLFELLDKSYNGPEDIQKVLRREIIAYSTASSYVHAGPSAVLSFETEPKKNIDMSSMLFTILAHQLTIGLLSRYPSENKEKLKTLSKEIKKKFKRAFAIYEKNIIS